MNAAAWVSDWARPLCDPEPTWQLTALLTAAHQTGPFMQLQPSFYTPFSGNTQIQASLCIPFSGNTQPVPPFLRKSFQPWREVEKAHELRYDIVMGAKSLRFGSKGSWLWK